MNAESERPAHQSVLYHEIILALRPQSPGCYVDGTVGAGGHAYGILEASAPAGRLLGLDLDPQALELASQRLLIFEGRYTLQQASYTTLLESIHQQGWEAVDGILVDLGVSSMQLDRPERGFSFLADGPLDMRFDPRQPTTAADLVNTLDEQSLADLLWRWGEEPQSRKIARAIVQNRPLQSTDRLAEVILKACGGRQGRIHPATRSFQALRIAVNRELDAVSDFLPRAVEALKPGGRLAVISFHSLEDRLVKQYFRQESRGCLCPPDQPVCTCGHQAVIREVSRKVITASEEEIRLNPRARSARLRVAEKLA